MAVNLSITIYSAPWHSIRYCHFLHYTVNNYRWYLIILNLNKSLQWVKEVNLSYSRVHSSKVFFELIQPGNESSSTNCHILRLAWKGKWHKCDRTNTLQPDPSWFLGSHQEYGSKYPKICIPDNHLPLLLTLGLWQKQDGKYFLNWKLNLH